MKPPFQRVGDDAKDAMASSNEAPFLRQQAQLQRQQAPVRADGHRQATSPSLPEAGTSGNIKGGGLAAMIAGALSQRTLLLLVFFTKRANCSDPSSERVSR